ncbi:MAG: magnesium transporter [Thiohalomonadaceae bacterium]
MNDQNPEPAAEADRAQPVRFRDEADIADFLETVKFEDEERFFAYLTSLPTKLQAETAVELSAPFQVDLVHRLDASALAALVAALETDDATDFMQLILEIDRDKGEAVFDALDDRIQQAVRRLMAYDEDEAGAWMQTEFFSVRSDETLLGSLKRLRRRRREGNGLGDMHYVHVVDENGRLLRLIPTVELILEPAHTHYAELLDRFPEPRTVLPTTSIGEAARVMEKYDLAVLPVVDRRGHLLGQITHDDVVDVIQEMATEQMYHLGRVGAGEELHESPLKTGRSRAFWLAINLANITLVSVVIGLFERALDAVVALAVLMPIVANMAGTASVQTLTVMVRQIALGELTPRNALLIFRKELIIATANGVLFGVLGAAISWYRYDSPLLGIVMALAMMVSFVAAGLLGAGVPVLLRRLGIDPALASSTLVLTLIDVIGFFSFLAFATVILL